VHPFVEEPRRQWPRIVAFVASAAAAAAILRLTWARPLLVAAILGGLSGLLRSGDVRRVLRRWSPSLARIPHPATMGPLMRATAFAAFGWVEKARAALETAERGPAWEAALEHRLFLDALLLTFEGDRDGALSQADRLERLPLPPAAEPALRDRIQMLRFAVGALCRAFAHQSQPGDGPLLERASESSPLVFWAMRYAAAVVAVDEQRWGAVQKLLEGAPAWPAESTFRAFHDEILKQIPTS